MAVRDLEGVRSAGDEVDRFGRWGESRSFPGLGRAMRSEALLGGVSLAEVRGA